MFVEKGQAFNFEFWAEEDDIRDIAAGARVTLRPSCHDRMATRTTRADL